MTAGQRQPMQMRICRWSLIAVATLLLSMLAALVFAGRWMAVDTGTPAPADVVVILAGSYDRTLHAADLYRKGMARRVVVSRPVPEPVHLRLAERGIPVTPEEDTHKRILTHLGVPGSAIDVLPGYARNTRDEAAALARYMGERSLRVIVVTSPFHVRRAAILVGRRLGQAQLIQVVATPYEEFEWRWWRDPASARAVLLELAKLLYFAVQRDPGE
jgi:uncharacterized SAM-binding protein YcdF (DUF218 family)